jgi:hypothetical protein
MLARVPQIDLIEETYLAAAPALVAAAIREPSFTAALWPDLQLTVFMDRGPAGIRWSATGPLVGSCEIWLEPYGDGVIAHTFLRADLTAPGSTTEPAAADPRGAVRELRRRARHAKQVWWRLKDSLEAGRRPGEPAAGRRPGGPGAGSGPGAPAAG